MTNKVEGGLPPQEATKTKKEKEKMKEILEFSEKEATLLDSFFQEEGESVPFKGRPFTSRRLYKFQGKRFVVLESGLSGWSSPNVMGPATGTSREVKGKKVFLAEPGEEWALTEKERVEAGKALFPEENIEKSGNPYLIDYYRKEKARIEEVKKEAEKNNAAVLEAKRHGVY